MIEKLSLFQLQEQTIKNKLQKAGINQTTLENDITINFYINRLDSRDYYILINQTTNKQNYFSDFIDPTMFDGLITIEDLVYYILHELKERYYLDNAKFEAYQLHVIENEKLHNVAARNEILVTTNKILTNDKEILSLKIEKLEGIKKLSETIQNIENELLKKQLKDLQNRNSLIAKDNKELKKEKKSIELELKRLQNILLNIQSIAV